MSTSTLLSRIEDARVKASVAASMRYNDQVVAVQPMLEANGDYDLLRQVITVINGGRFSSKEEAVEFVRVLLS
jgi:hypothetical protein